MIKIYFFAFIILLFSLQVKAKGIINIESETHIFNINCNDKFKGKKIIYNIEIINKKTKLAQNIKVKYPPKFKYSIGGINNHDIILVDINKDGILDLIVTRNSSDFYLYENYFCYLSNKIIDKFNILEGFENIDDFTFYRIEDSINLNNTYEKCDCKYQNKYSLENNKIESSKISTLNKVEKTYSKFEMPNKSDKKYKEFNYKIKNYTFNFILDTLYRKDTFNTHFLEVLDSNSKLIQNFKLDDLNIYFDYWVFEKEYFKIDDILLVMDLNLDGYNDFILKGSNWPSFTTTWKYNNSTFEFSEILQFNDPEGIS